MGRRVPTIGVSSGRYGMIECHMTFIVLVSHRDFFFLSLRGLGLFAGVILRIMSSPLTVCSKFIIAFGIF